MVRSNASQKGKKLAALKGIFKAEIVAAVDTPPASNIQKQWRTGKRRRR